MTDTDDNGEIAKITNDRDPREQQRHNTLLPSPLAALVSFATATGSLSLRVASFFGGGAISLVRHGTLTGFEVGRSALEAILTRAGQDVIDTNSGQMGRAAAEGVLRNALNSLHYAITHSSFLVSAGFHIGSTSLSSSLAVAQYFINFLDAVFGDTDTSKATATIIAMVQREYGNHQGESISTMDIVTGLIGFVLLQRWSWDKMQEAIVEAGVEEVLLDIVVLAADQRSGQQSTVLTQPDVPPEPSSPQTTRPYSRMSFVSAMGDKQPFDGVSFNDGASFYTEDQFSTLDATQSTFRRELLYQLKPGSSVKITTSTVVTHSITVEINGDSTSCLQPPPGYDLVAAENHASPNGTGQTLVFRNRQEQKRITDVESLKDVVDTPRSERTDKPLPSDPRVFLNGDATLKARLKDQPRIEANQKRQRSGMSSEPSLNDNESIGRLNAKRHSFRKAMKTPRNSYKNLVELWNPSKLKPTQRRSDSVSSPLQTPDGATPQTPSSSGSPVVTKKKSSDALTIESPLKQTFPGYRRGNSSIFTLETKSTQSLVLRTDTADDSHDRIVQISRNGNLPGQYPPLPFAQNVARFARFATAAYGEYFLRLTGSVGGKEYEMSEADRQHLAEHLTFAKYTGMPATSMLLSSFVDPQGGPNAAGQAETGLPLVHYISLDYTSKAVVLTFRGTLGFEDILTDLSADYDELIWEGKPYAVHQGILASARRLLSLRGGTVVATIKAALEEFEDYGLILCGHSLGGAVAAVVAILLAQRNPSTAQQASAFVTKTDKASRLLTRSSSADGFPNLLPAGRPIHVYAYGPAAALSPELQVETRGLITTIVNNMDHIPYLSLGTLRDVHAIAYAYKTDSSNAKAEVRRRVWQGFRDVFRNSTGFAGFGGGWHEARRTTGEEDHWPWTTLKSLRVGLRAEKLVPPGEVFIISSEPVLQRFAFVHDLASDNQTRQVGNDGRSFRPMTRIRVAHVRDVATRFSEVRFGASMYTDHFPARYVKNLEILERGLG
ncbi:hypothetical protein K469DRAFT_709920 [Zopfia rhizophila CBS 207.26]|uniref:sn-1-specific diacylglycerol lipase n=1 Tax=Zopfia rhizophila CBS 207.26 TaxID=1314779 RepID=A0A6A6DWH9_9PEZI|nr:hypothetical protein K469DRAFT_709920 [Zopfia rhizophila CBS 207.26]